MQLLSIIFLLLVVWWIAFAICVASDKARQTTPKPQSAVPHDVPRWPAWSEYRTRPSLFFIIPWCALLYGVVFVFIWPAIPIHKLWLWTHRKREDDHAA